MNKTKNIYVLPCNIKEVQGVFSNPQVHKDHYKYAIDFVIPEDSKIYAAKGGEVVDVKVDSNEGGLQKKYATDIKYTNYITIKHANNEFSQYVHLKYKGAKVKKGERVKKGQCIGVSGNTGYSSQPHLHFQIFHLTKKAPGWETLKINFTKPIKVKRK